MNPPLHRIHITLACPACGGRRSYVTDSRPVAAFVRRRRICSDCQHGFTTRETVHERVRVSMRAFDPSI